MYIGNLRIWSHLLFIVDDADALVQLNTPLVAIDIVSTV